MTRTIFAAVARITCASSCVRTVLWAASMPLAIYGAPAARAGRFLLVTLPIRTCLLYYSAHPQFLRQDLGIVPSAPIRLLRIIPSLELPESLFRNWEEAPSAFTLLARPAVFEAFMR